MPSGQNRLLARSPRFCRQRRFLFLSFWISNLFRFSILGFRISGLAAASVRVRLLPFAIHHCPGDQGVRSRVCQVRRRERCLPGRRVMHDRRRDRRPISSRQRFFFSSARTTWHLALHSIVITTNPLVLPGTSNGWPARTIIRSPDLATCRSVHTREASATAPMVSCGVSVR